MSHELEVFERRIGLKSSGEVAAVVTVALCKALSAPSLSSGHLKLAFSQRTTVARMQTKSDSTVVLRPSI